MTRDRVRPTTVTAVVAAAMLALVGCGSTADTSDDTVPAAGSATGSVVASAESSSASTGATAETLRLGYFANITHALPLVGVQDGTYEAALGDTALEVQIFNAGPAAVEALFGGALDASYIGPNPAINAFVKSEGEAVRIVAGASSGGAQLVVRPEFTDAASLKGQTLATPQLGGTQDVALRYWLQENGLSAPTTGEGDVIVAPQENAQTLELFRSGDIAGAWVPEPWASRLVLEGGGVVLVDETDLWPDGSFVTTHLIVASEYLTEYPGTIAALLQAELDTLDAVEADPDAAKTTANEALTELTGKPLDEAVLDRAWDNLTLTVDPVASTLQTAADHAVEVGVSDAADLDGIYDLTLLNAQLGERGGEPVSAAGLGLE